MTCQSRGRSSSALTSMNLISNPWNGSYGRCHGPHGRRHRAHYAGQTSAVRPICSCRPHNSKRATFCAPQEASAMACSALFHFSEQSDGGHRQAVGTDAWVNLDVPDSASVSAQCGTIRKRRALHEMVERSGFHCSVRCGAMLPRPLAIPVLACHKQGARGDETPRSSALLVTSWGGPEGFARGFAE